MYILNSVGTAANQIIHQVSSRLDPRYNYCTVEINTVTDGKLTDGKWHVFFLTNLGIYLKNWVNNQDIVIKRMSKIIWSTIMAINNYTTCNKCPDHINGLDCKMRKITFESCSVTGHFLWKLFRVDI